ncbi:class I SAM-dependent methyltransferase [Leptolyngbya sp. CCNP1308]|uniref:class I SAM-dependent methyltransferase n=1 Tax=Leptolyngbya sp. CCNP1308 TaxID=3110255 RepID=UPI002B200DF1|nr:class I SAM-dependent methyltransferase [Leptolyngbya sp. CCNP1308]MEA5453003.1 class I SAM-dependent methyltransferase [Leptolyngbya sp. CCNP1308]
MSYAEMWDHNTHYHRYLLSQIPNRVNRSLDIGCGLGLFARKLAERSNSVDALDVDEAVLAEASGLSFDANIAYINGDFLATDLPETAYDVTVAIASLHHMNMAAALQKIRLLLRPSGKLLILGLYREKTPIDYAYSAISIPLNFVYGQWHRASTARSIKVAPTRPAQLSLKQIKKVADAIIPGYRLRRHLFWRYSLIWQKP